METIKNKRNIGWFKINNILIDEYSQYLGPLPTLVYTALKRYEDKNSNTAWPSEEHLSEKLKVSKRSIIRAIKVLVNHRLITKNKTKEKGQWLHNKYYFLSIDKWSKFPIGNLDKSFSIKNNMSDKNSTNQVTHDYIINNNKKEISVNSKTNLGIKFSDYKPNFLK